MPFDVLGGSFNKAGSWKAAEAWQKGSLPVVATWAMSPPHPGARCHRHHGARVCGRALGCPAASGLVCSLPPERSMPDTTVPEVPALWTGSLLSVTA